MENPKNLVSNPKNWRKHPKIQADAMLGVLEDIGWIQDIIVNERTGKLVDGHLRVEIALKNGEPEVPVKYVDLSEEEEEKALITFDPITAMAEADKELLNSLVERCKTDNEEVKGLLADIAEKEKLEFGKKEIVDDDFESREPETIETEIKPGDILLLGRHRVMCGDSTSAEDVGRLMEGKKADLCMTDPPYGADIQYATHDDTQGALIELIGGFFPLAEKHCKLIALTPGINNLWHYKKPDWVLCWFYGAGTGRTPWGFSTWQPIMVWGKCPKLAAGEGCHPDGFQYMMSRDDAHENKCLGHACPKPLSVWRRFIERLSNKKTELIYDPFTGSGTTLIACEQLGRTCYGMEISPQYCEVICQRWEKLTGEKRTIIGGCGTNA